MIMPHFLYKGVNAERSVHLYQAHTTRSKGLDLSLGGSFTFLTTGSGCLQRPPIPILLPTHLSTRLQVPVKLGSDSPTSVSPPLSSRGLTFVKQHNGHMMVLFQG